MDNMSEWTDTKKQLVQEIIDMGFPEQLGDEVAKNLGSPKAMRRMISYLRKVKPKKFSLPLLVVIILMFAFWVTIPLLIIGMFCGYKYRFEGVETVAVNLNDLSDKASLEIEALKKKYES